MHFMHHIARGHVAYNAASLRDFVSGSRCIINIQRHIIISIPYGTLNVGIGGLHIEHHPTNASQR